MPGILPMKVIKVGSNCQQSRIAQACDRCRSKKIRCDGIRPCCTQCANVGFECKTSDKLSRRAFPRGYTESLEERVRQLENEVRELKDLLDEKDEKIDLLSRVHSFSPTARSVARKLSLQSPKSSLSREESHEKDDTFTVQRTHRTRRSVNGVSNLASSSSGMLLIDAFMRKANECGKLYKIDSSAFSNPTTSRYRSPRHPTTDAPPRLVSDQMVNNFFQEWAPLFPVLHKPTFLSLYEQYTASPELKITYKSAAQLHLVFGIAALSSSANDSCNADSSQDQWQSAIEHILMDDDIETLQCLILAQIHCLLRADYPRLLKYKGLAVSLAQHLGLHESHKGSDYATLTSETYKKVFWTLYVVDCFSAAHLGLPKLLHDEDISCEYPTDVDDEYLTDEGFLPTLPGESTRLSSALALFRLSRVLSQVITEFRSPETSYDISLRTIASLADELEEWLNTLAPHLKLKFAQDKPSTNVTGSRSPILSLAYHHVRSLIYHPVIIADLGERGSSAMVAVADASKHIIQIIQLLDERRLSFSFCLNRNDVLVQAGFGLLFQTINLDVEGKLIKDCSRLIYTLMDMLDDGKASGASEFRRAGSSLATVPRVDDMPTPSPSFSCRASDIKSATSNSPHSIYLTNPLKSMLSRFYPATKSRSHLSNRDPELRRATISAVPSKLGSYTNPSSASLSSIHSEPHTIGPNAQAPLYHRASFSTAAYHNHPQNLDYPSLTSQPLHYTLPHSYLPSTKSTHPSSSSDTEPDSSWTALLSSLDNGPATLHNSIYGGCPPAALLGTSSALSLPAYLDLEPAANPDIDANALWTTGRVASAPETEPWSWSVPVSQFQGQHQHDGTTLQVLNNSSLEGSLRSSVDDTSPEGGGSGAGFAAEEGEWGNESTPGSEGVYGGVSIGVGVGTGMNGLGGLDAGFGL